ncbi:MAG: type II toxin-antitoxin system HicA family toxin [Xenococcus sp. (in: cyanobacteria)]
MPKKIKELKKILRKAGFTEKPAKGSHTKWSHPLVSGKIVLSGKDGNDAKPYQEKDVEQAIEKIKEIQRQGED